MNDAALAADQTRAGGNGAAGLISYAMPHSCLLSDHFHQLLERRKQTPGIELDVTIQSSMDVLDSVLEGQVDFGFATAKREDPGLTYIPYCREEYMLVARSFPEGFKPNEQWLTEIGFIAFPGCENYARAWLPLALGADVRLGYGDFKKIGECNALDGAILMVTGGLGVSLFPRHTIARQLESGAVVEYPLTEPVTNQIYIVHAAERRLPGRVAMIIRWFLDMESSEIPESVGGGPW